MPGRDIFHCQMKWEQWTNVSTVKADRLVKLEEKILLRKCWHCREQTKKEMKWKMRTWTSIYTENKTKQKLCQICFYLSQIDSALRPGGKESSSLLHSPPSHIWTLVQLPSYFFFYKCRHPCFMHKILSMKFVAFPNPSPACCPNSSSFVHLFNGTYLEHSSCQALC